MVSIELDRALLPILAETMAPYSNVEIVPGDVTRLDLKALIGEKFAGLRPIVCANLPYNITTPVLTALVDIPAIESITVLIQKEAAQRLTSAKGSRRRVPPCGCNTKWKQNVSLTSPGEISARPQGDLHRSAVRPPEGAAGGRPG